jgi:hypothetical protein
MRRGLALLLLGAWLGILAATWGMAGFNLRAADRLLGPGGRAELAERMAATAPADRQAALRFLGAELNRGMFRAWAVAQLGLGTALLALLWSGGGLPRWLSALALGFVLAQGAVLGPLTERGRALDFVPRPLPAAEARSFGLLHATYLGVDLLKLGALLGAAFVLLHQT